MEKECECYEEEVQPYRKTDCTLIIYILMADKHNILKDKLHSNCRLLPDHIACKITQRNNIRRANICDSALKLLNEEITSDIHKHKQNIWKEHLDAHWDHRHNTHILVLRTQPQNSIMPILLVLWYLRLLPISNWTTSLVDCCGWLPSSLYCACAPCSLACDQE